MSATRRVFYGTGYTAGHARQLARALRARGAKVRQRRAFLRITASGEQVRRTLLALHRTGDSFLTLDRGGMRP